MIKKKIETDEERIYTDTLFSADTATSAIKNSISSSFIIPFAMALGAPSTMIALISSLPELIGSFFQLFVTDLLKIINNRKRIIVITSAIDAILWLPILLIPFIWQNNYYILLYLTILQAISLSILRPFYSTLLGDIIPTNRRGKVLSKINKISSAVSFLSTLIFGYLLKVLNPINPFYGFSIIFGFALISRLSSAVLKSKYKDPYFEFATTRQSIFSFTRNIRKTRFGIFVLYTSLFYFACGIAAPFYTVYLIDSLKFDYFTYTILTGAAIISSFYILDRLGRELDVRGSKWMLDISSFVIPIIPIFWMVFKSPYSIFILQIISGAAWAAFSLAMSNYILDETTRKDRLIMTAYFYFFIGLFTFLGSMLGGFLVSILANDIMAKTYIFIFGLSGVLRLIVSAYFIPIITGEKIDKDDEFSGPSTRRVVSFSTAQGTVFDYVAKKRK